MRPKSTTGGSKDLSDHFAFDRGSYTKALLSGNFSALLQNCRIARRPPSASGSERTLLAELKVRCERGAEVRPYSK